MLNKVKSVNTFVKFHFGNGLTYELPLKNNNIEGMPDLRTYGKSISINEYLYDSSGNNIVGNVKCNSLSINIVSNDKLLISSNEDSPYFGFMDDTAYVDISAYIVEEDKNISLGRYYVSTWENGVNSTSANDVSISCVDLLSKVKNIPINKLRLTNNIDIKSFLKLVVDKVNIGLPEHMKILYNEDDLDIYRNSKYKWQMLFNNIDRQDLETIFNSIAKNTLSYIWIDRYNHLRTDHLLDDSYKEDVSTLSGSVNLLEYGIQSGDVGKYSGVKVTYIDSVSYKDISLLKMNNIVLVKGVNTFNDISLGNSSTFNVHLVKVQCKSGYAICKSFDVYKGSVDLVIDSSDKTEASIELFGSVAEETKSSFNVYLDENKKADVIEVDNNILRKELIHTYGNGLLSIMRMKNGRLYASGYVNPSICLGDSVFVIGSRLGVNNSYKVVGMELGLGVNYRCKVSLMRTIAVEPSIIDILFNLEEALYDRLSGLYVDVNKLDTLTDEENRIVEMQLEHELYQLRQVLYGGEAS